MTWFYADLRCEAPPLEPKSYSTLGLTAGISNVVRQLEISHDELLPDLRLGPTVVMASDYSGQQKGATHESFSFLIADLAFCWRWDEERRRVRATYFSEQRRMSYKALNDRLRCQALLPFLSAADLIPGLLATVLVDKAYARSFELTPMDRAELPPEIAGWPRHVILRMMFVAHLGALFLAGLSNSGQNALWFTDNDDFVANDDRVLRLTPLLAGIVGRYSEQAMGHFRFGTMKCDNGDLMIEDLASLPDLACGALGEVPTRGLLPRNSAIQIPLRDHLPAKALAILNWIGASERPLRRLTFVVDIGDSADKVQVRALELSPE
jgi:hypothetical protein